SKKTASLPQSHPLEEEKKEEEKKEEEKEEVRGDGGKQPQVSSRAKDVSSE
ncbi:hypothetical protein ADUPG1_014984, partial [Aduncisulcus paluster]